MATSSLIRLLTALLMLTGLALSSSLAWAQEQPTEQPTPTQPAEQTQPTEQPTPRPFPPPEEDMPYTSYNQQTSGPSDAWIVTRDALLGGIFGAILGTAGYFISGRDWSPLVIVYSAAGGVVLGTTVGLVSVLSRDDQQFSASHQFLQRDLPKTRQIQLINLSF